ncbi:MAG TPA: PASTA domain-containing protein [Gemmatimonadales bacterium]|nr:PASTA domain-containing protein [Gemmatimonadales bacterium]
MRFRRQVPWARHAAEPAGPEAPAAEPGAPESAAPRAAHPPFLATVFGRRLVRDAVIVLGTFAVGYVLARAWLSPVPLITSDHSVPRVLELTGGEAQRRLTALGFRVKFDDERAHPTIPRGSIVWQDPAPGTVLAQNSIVSVAPSAGPQLAPVPDIVGLPMPFAIKVLAAAGLKPGSVDTVTSDPEPNVVIATRPAAGAGREAGSTVDLVVSGQPKAPASQAARIIQRPFSTGVRR